jgi:DNA-binding transcriptional LysR family regulator
VDFALTAADPQHADLHYVPLRSDSFLLLIPEAHPLARVRGPLRWADTADAAHVSMVQPSSVRQYTEWAFLQNRIRFAPAFEAEHLTTIVAMVECGFGVAALPEIAAGAVAQNGIVQRPLTGPVAERSIGLVTSRNRSLSPAAAALVQALKDYLAAQPR